MLSNMKNILRDRSVFAQKVVPYATLIISGIYGAANSPKLLTIPDAKVLLQPIYTFWLSTSLQGPRGTGVQHRQYAHTAAQGSHGFVRVSAAASHVDILQSDASKPFEEQSFIHEVHGVW
ncbi:hypothetical protein OTU49_009129 [Cherax quadricarinatus]|uniref:Uncharacterized protein n=1 Tax=Cherax quadricarinatus TaxID=27406 RepID=A0AAW0WLP0_CHEQU